MALLKVSKKDLPLTFIVCVKKHTNCYSAVLFSGRVGVQFVSLTHARLFADV